MNSELVHALLELRRKQTKPRRPSPADRAAARALLNLPTRRPTPYDRPRVTGRGGMGLYSKRHFASLQPTPTPTLTPTPSLQLTPTPSVQFSWPPNTSYICGNAARCSAGGICAWHAARPESECTPQVDGPAAACADIGPPVSSAAAKAAGPETSRAPGPFLQSVEGSGCCRVLDFFTAA